MKKAGIGLRWQHLEQVFRERPPLAWIELITENVFGAGARTHEKLRALADLYPVALHGVGLNLGGTAPLCDRYLRKMRAEIDSLRPFAVSDHLCWNGVGNGAYLPELLPLPWTPEAVLHVSDRIKQVQDTLGREILIENVSAYYRWDDSLMPEWEFLSETARRAECGILLDVNNVYVNSRNLGFSADAYLAGLDGPVREIHLAGHTAKDGMLIDTHSAPVAEPVWQLLEQALKHHAKNGPVPVLIEWDQDLPELSILTGEAKKADSITDRLFGRPT